MTEIRFDNQVAIVTGAGTGLGRSHALELARRGAKVVVNDLGQEGAPSAASQGVVAEITALGGEAFAHPADVSKPVQVQDMVDRTIDRWGRIDVLINNAGILRDKSFAKMDPADFRLVCDVHLNGTFYCTQAVWTHMKAQGYGRILFTASGTGLYGNFGQANYGAAKMGMVGLMNTLCIEGAKDNILINTIAPSALTPMTENLIRSEMADLMSVESVTAGTLALVDRDAPNRCIMSLGCGTYAVTRIYESPGHHLEKDQQTPEGVRAAWANISDRNGERELMQVSEQSGKLKALAGV